MFNYSPINQHEKLSIGVVGKPDRRLNLFGEFKLSPQGASETEAGFRVKFPEWSVTGSLSSSGKAMSVWRHSFDFFEITW